MRADVMDGLIQAHLMEQYTGKMIGRKEIHSYLPSDLSFEEKREAIHNWQSEYFPRVRNVFHNMENRMNYEGKWYERSPRFVQAERTGQ